MLRNNRNIAISARVILISSIKHVRNKRVNQQQQSSLMQCERDAKKRSICVRCRINIFRFNFQLFLQLQCFSRERLLLIAFFTWRCKLSQPSHLWTSTWQQRSNASSLFSHPLFAIVTEPAFHMLVLERLGNWSFHHLPRRPWLEKIQQQASNAFHKQTARSNENIYRS